MLFIFDMCWTLVVRLVWLLPIPKPHRGSAYSGHYSRQRTRYRWFAHLVVNSSVPVPFARFWRIAYPTWVDDAVGLRYAAFATARC